MSKRRHEWTSPTGEQFALDLSGHAPRLQLLDGGEWDDVHPRDYPLSLFAELSEVLADRFDAEEDAARHTARQDREEAEVAKIREVNAAGVREATDGR